VTNLVTSLGREKRKKEGKKKRKKREKENTYLHAKT
jgi:hypothetical protein